jgi:hypothetical protein
MATQRKPASVPGYTESAWKSVAVKSLRIGWPAGLRYASGRLSPSTMKGLVTVGLFEDVFPARDEWGEVRAELKVQDYEALCLRDTHHGRGWTEAFCDLADEAIAASSDPAPMFPTARELGIFMPRRGWNVFYTWMKLRPDDPGRIRPVDTSPWRGMPLAMLDCHTVEGKRRFKGAETFLSGTYDRHRSLGRTVQANGGWDEVREMVHASIDGTPE